MTTIAPAFVIVYALVMSIVVYDWVMTLEPHWFSTMIGPWFFMGAFWGGIACTALWSLYLRTQDTEFKNHIGLQQRHDIGKLAFAFSGVLDLPVLRSVPRDLVRQAAVGAGVDGASLGPGVLGSVLAAGDRDVLRDPVRRAAGAGSRR